MNDFIEQLFETLAGGSMSDAALAKGAEEIIHALSVLKEVDTYVTEISKVNNSLSKSDLAKLGTDSFGTASKYGKTATDYLAEVQTMSLAGYKNAAAMAELSTAAQTAGNITSELANAYITAADSAYEMNGDVQALTQALDGANHISDRNAIDLTELAEGISADASQAASSQMSVEEMTAAIGTLVAVTDQGGAEMGSALNGVLMNLRQVTGEAGDGGELIDESSLARYKKACEAFGVSLSSVKDGVVTLKEPMQILKELSGEYTKLSESDPRKANLLSSMGGANRADALDAILSNYSLYEKLLQDYADGEGSMAKDAEKTAQSWEGSLNRLSNSWTQFVGTLTDEEAFIGGINLLSDFVGGISEVSDRIGGLSTVGAGLGAYLGAKNLGRGKIVPPPHSHMPIVI